MFELLYNASWTNPVNYPSFQSLFIQIQMIGIALQRSFKRMIMTKTSVLFQETLGSRQVIMNRPDRLNAIDFEMTECIHSKLKTWERSGQANMIFFKSLGRALCAGGNVKDIMNSLLDPSGQKALDDYLNTIYNMIYMTATMRTPYIAIMDGITMGAGGGLCAFAPFRIATEKTQFSMPETTIAWFCDMGSNFFLSRLDGCLYAYLGATSRVIKGENVLFSGIATHFVPSARIEEMEAHLAKLESPTHNRINAAIGEFSVKRNHIPKTFTLHGDQRSTIDKCFKHEKMEEVIEALNKDGSLFAREVEKIKQRSLTGVKVTHELLRRGLGLSLKECLRRERILSQTVSGPDFIEGVTSYVIDQRAANWSPARLEDLDLNHTTETSPLIHIKYTDCPQKKPTISHSSDTIAWFDQETNGKFGVREKVMDVLERNSIYSSSRL